MLLIPKPLDFHGIMSLSIILKDDMLGHKKRKGKSVFNTHIHATLKRGHQHNNTSGINPNDHTKILISEERQEFYLCNKKTERIQKLQEAYDLAATRGPLLI